VPARVTGVAFSVKVPVVRMGRMLFWLVIVLGLPLQLIDEDVKLTVPPVLVIAEPATIVTVVDVAVKVLLTLFVIVVGLPFNSTVEAELVVKVPELVIEEPAPKFNVDADTLRLLVLVVLLIKLGLLKVTVEPRLAETAPALVILEPPFNVNVDADKEIVPVLLLVIGTGLLPVTDDTELAVMAPELLTVVPPPQFNVEAVSVMPAPLLFVKVQGLPVTIVEFVLAIIWPELVILLPPPTLSCDVVKVIVPVLLLVIVPGFPEVMPTAALELRLPLLSSVPPAFIDKVALKVTVLFAPIVSVDGFPTDEFPLKVAELKPANVKLSPPLTVRPPLTVSAADKVRVVVPLIVIDLHNEATSTVGLFAVAGMVTSSKAPGLPWGAQLVETLQRVLVVPVQVKAAALAFLIPINKAHATKQKSSFVFIVRVFEY
jgi:hypothetical protein